MTPLLLALALVSPTQVDRDSFGVARIQASSFEEACRAFGRVVADDRLWQMEMSRRVAEGRMSEIVGKSALAADIETLKSGYSDDEYDEMFKALTEKARTAFTLYAEGVNDSIEERKKSGTLPQGYKDQGFSPEPWTVRDSMAIEVMLARRFGTGGSGELRNLALYLYLQTQPVKDKVLDVVDDFAWQNDPRSIPTVSPADDSLAQSHPVFPTASRKQTIDHLKLMPKVSLLELVPAIRAANQEDSRLIAEHVSAPFETGSYCMVVSPKRSATGRALLLTGPQMGFATPSIVHEIAIQAPGFDVAGIDVPGIPAVVIGNTPNFAWGLTTGVADIADIVVAQTVGETAYKYGSLEKPIDRQKLRVKVKDAPDATVERVRTGDGPVLFESRATKTVFSQRSAFWKKEVSSWSSLYNIYGAKDSASLDAAVDQIAMNMNFFFATTSGDIGWRYLGLMPVRAPGYDSRFPLPAGPQTDWLGMVSRKQMPHVDNPKTGLIANWNNKPASWWPNMDTPAWGRLFRNEVLLGSLSKPKLATWDLEHAAWDIAHKDTETNNAFASLFIRSTAGTSTSARSLIEASDGWAFQGNGTALLYREAVRRLRVLMFDQHVGNFTNPSFFEQIVQPSVLLNAVEGSTKFNYLAGRKSEQIARQAVEEAHAALVKKYSEDMNMWPTGGGIKFQSEQPVAYSNRGTYIQINELWTPPIARSVAPPGVAETGNHSLDQVPLSRQWTFKPVWRLASIGKSG